jgi:hypothetical protein
LATQVRILVDADGCPVKQEVYRVAERYGAEVLMVANASLWTPGAGSVRMIVVKGDFNAADDWIAENAGPTDVVVTIDVPLAERSLQRGAEVLGHRGQRFTAETIGRRLATRALLDHLRQTGEATGGPAPFSKADRSRFLAALDQTVVAVRKRLGETGRGKTE